MTRALLGIAALVVAIGAGAALGALLFRPVSPRGLEETPAAVDTPVVQRTIDDRRSIRLALELGPSASLKSPSDGLITESACQAGQAIASGDHMMTLGDQRLYALATAIPLWRDLGPGDQGDDVTALQAELQRLGYLVDADGRIGPQTLRSVADLVGLSGTPAFSSYALIPRASFVWLPEPSVVPSSCAASVGEGIVEHDEIAVLDRTLVRARVVDMPADLLPGQRLLTVDGRDFPVEEAGILEDPQALAELQTTSSYQHWLSAQNDEPAPNLDASLSLAEPTLVHAVSPSAIYEVDAADACVLDNGVPRPVTIVSSELGQTHILFPDGAPAPASLPAPPRNAASCR